MRPPRRPAHVRPGPAHMCAGQLSEIAHGVVDSLLTRRYGRCGADRVADAFLSYSRLDGTFVRRLASALEERGKTVWVDVDGIRDGEVFPEALRRAIESSDAFVFVISPDAVQLLVLRGGGRARRAP